MADSINVLTRECCICGGTSTLYTTGSAHIEANGKEYRVFYHSACLTEKTKETVTKMLNEMAARDQ